MGGEAFEDSVFPRRVVKSGRIAMDPIPRSEHGPLSANVQPTPSKLPRKPRRRWLQISLRTLLILVTLLSIGLGWFVHRGERQRRAVTALKELGGEMHYASDLSEADTSFDLSQWPRRDYFDDVLIVSLSRCKMTDADLGHIQDLTRLECLELDGTRITDAGLAHLQGLTRLQVLDLSETQVTDAGLTRLQGMAELWQLHLTDTRVTDAGLAHLQGLTRLEWLYLDGTQVTDTGLAHLKGMTELTDLGLTGTRVTDAGFRQLHGLKRLQSLHLGETQVTDAILPQLQELSPQYLSLRGTQITDAGIAELQKALPNCDIRY